MGNLLRRFEQPPPLERRPHVSEDAAAEYERKYGDRAPPVRQNAFRIAPCPAAVDEGPPPFVRQARMTERDWAAAAADREPVPESAFYAKRRSGKRGTFYCVKCRAKVTVRATAKRRARNGRTYLTATCPRCRTKMCRFV